jgi:hypothetical protein
MIKIENADTCAYGIGRNVKNVEAVPFTVTE